MIVLNAQQLQRLAEALLRLERLLESEGGDPSVLRKGLEQEAHRMGVHLAVVRLADADTLLRLHGPAVRGDPGKLWAIAELLFLDGLRCRAEGLEEEAAGRLGTAAILFEAVEPGLRLPDGTVPPPDRAAEARAILSRSAP